MGKALGLAMARVSDKLMELEVAAEETAMSTRSLAELLDEIPEGGLYALLEGPQEAQGVMVLDARLMGALIEQQTAGALAPGGAVARRPTRTDAALCADWIDRVLAALQEVFAEAPEASWLTGFGFSSHLPDARPLALMLEDEPYRLLDFRLDIGSGARKGGGKLILPALGRAPEGRPARAEGGEGASPDARRDWSGRIEAQVMEAEVTLRAVLHRREMTIGEVLALEAGGVLTLPASAIGALRLEASDGSAVARGKLGQSGGLRAVRLSDAEEEAAPAADPLGAAMALAEEEEEPAGLPDIAQGELPELPEMAATGLPAADAGDGLPDLPDLPEISGDLPELPELPELSGDGDAAGGLPSIDIADLTGT